MLLGMVPLSWLLLKSLREFAVRCAQSTLSTATSFGHATLLLTRQVVRGRAQVHPQVQLADAAGDGAAQLVVAQRPT